MRPKTTSSISPAFRLTRVMSIVWMLLVPMIGGLASSPSPAKAVPVTQQAATSQLEIRIIIESVSAKDEIDGPGSAPDMYAVVNIDGRESNNHTTAIEDQSNITPNWQFFDVVDASRKEIPVALSIFDRDGFLRFDDDQVDIASNEGRTLDLLLDLNSCAVRGDGIVGTCGTTLNSSGAEDDRADIRFRIEVRPTVPVKFKLVIERVKQWECVDEAGPSCPSDGDWFAIINIDGQELGNLENKIEEDEFSPNWEFRKEVDFGKNSIPVTIGLFDEDASLSDGFSFSTNQGDIKPGLGKTLRLSIDLNACILGGADAISGDISGRCGNSLNARGSEDSDQAEIWFRIEVEPPPSAPGTNVRCLHGPIWPQATDTITITAESLAGDPSITKSFNVEIEIWINNKNAPVVTESNRATLTASTGPFNAGDTFFYGCLVRDKTSGERVWSGWRRVQVGLPLEGRAVPLVYTGSRASSIDIVFVADRDSYTRPSDVLFLDDIQQVIRNSYYNRRIYLENQDKLNFWLALDMGRAEDSADGCDHEVSDSGDYNFADTSAIVHRKSIRDCATGGERIFSGRIPDYDVFTHETGHRPFGLADEYCNRRNPPAGNSCDGGYFQNDPFPNLCAEPESCIADISNLQAWDERLRQPVRSTADCKEFEADRRWFLNSSWSVSDPATDDLMVDNGTIRGADARRMDWLFGLCDRASCGSAQANALQVAQIVSQAATSIDPISEPVPDFDFAQQRASKSLNVRLDFLGRDQVELNTSQLVTGQTHTYLGDPPLLRIRLLDRDNKLLQEYKAWHPLWTFTHGNDGLERLIIENDATGRFITPFLPRLKSMEIYDIAQQKLLTTINLESSVIRPFCEQNPSDRDCRTFPFNNRVINGLQVLYLFDERAGSVVNDVSGVGKPLNLRIATPSATQWTTEGLRISSPTVLASAGPATKLITAAQQSNELTIEAWIKPTNTTQNGPARIATLAGSATGSNFTLGQGRWGNQLTNLFDVRLRTTDTSNDGRPSLVSPEGTATTDLTHVVYTRDANGLARLYINGEEKATRTVTGDFSNWAGDYRLALGAEINGAFPWLGEYQLAAFYSRALTPQEVLQNFGAGPSGYDQPPPVVANEDLFAYNYELWTEPAAPHANAPTQIGLVVHRNGGKQVLEKLHVRFYEGNPSQGGRLIGDAIVDRLSPRSSAISSGATWVPSASGVYPIYAVIDPDNRVVEANETNNVVWRNVGVLAATADQVAPHVDSFSINDGAASTTEPTLTLKVSASDPEPGTGVQSVLFVEFEYHNDVGDWVPVQRSGWLDYHQPESTYQWILRPAAGVKYLQAWARDGAGNISLYPYQRFISYTPPEYSISRGETQVYRFTVKAGQRLTARLEPLSGDPDLYVWAPDASAGRPPWVSNLRTGIDTVSFVAPVSGVYQVEVFGYTAARYRLGVRIEAVQANALARAEAASTVGQIDPTKPLPSQPVVPLESVPSVRNGIVDVSLSTYTIFLPSVAR